jgi:uncharacterized Zn finger protein
MSTNTVPSGATLSKAERIHRRGRVHDLGPARAFRVVGDTGTPYTVLVFTLATVSRPAWCSCPASGTCKHLLAVAIELQREGK